MRYSSILIPIVGVTLLSFSVAAAQLTVTHEIKPAKQGTQTTSRYAKHMKRMASKSAMMTNQAASKMPTKAVLKTKNPTATKRTTALAKGAKTITKKPSSHASQTKTSKASSGSAQHVKHSLKKDQSKTQKKSKS